MGLLLYARAPSAELVASAAAVPRPVRSIDRSINRIRHGVSERKRLHTNTKEVADMKNERMCITAAHRVLLCWGVVAYLSFDLLIDG